MTHGGARKGAGNKSGSRRVAERKCVKKMALFTESEWVEIEKNMPDETISDFMGNLVRVAIFGSVGGNV